jgi:amino acid permease
MLGGSILVLPVVGIKVGYVTVITFTIVLGLISCYTVYLIMKHVGNAKTFKGAVLSHFGNDPFYSKLFNLFMAFSQLPWIFAYFHLLILQIKGLFSINSELLPFGVLILVIILTLVMKHY